ncbi:MAG TPA: S1 RNA-binding domain-containing protein [Isosphaeraceae bacterium]|nr:S1 RNA-binding domain-containing protein [Isosphaeraceae bacterium]
MLTTEDGQKLMADPIDQPTPVAKPGPGLQPSSGNAGSHQDAALGDALEKVMANARAEVPPEVPLKRQWDAELEAEMEAALTGFDPKTFDVARERPKTTDRAQGAGRDRGQEARKGTSIGTVICVRGRSLFVDLGGKSEGVIPLDQFEGEIPAPGAQIEVIVDHFDISEGIQHLRLKGAAIEASWENLRKGVIVEARGTKVIKGGLEVDVDGIRGFMPISQIDLSRVEDATAYVNQKFKAIVTEANQREKNLVVSRRDLLEQERAEQREQTWASLEEGQVREGTVRSIKDFGAFVDLGGVDGLLPIGEMSWSRIQKVDDLVKTGDKVQVKVIKIDPVARKLTLGLKQLTPSPWEKAESNYPRGLMITGKVTKLMEFGAFVELEPGIEGLIHITELSPTRVRRVTDIIQAGQEVEVRILKVEPGLKRIAVSLLPAKDKKTAAADDDEEEHETPTAPKPERKIPLKGGLGDKDTRFKGLTE